MFIRLIYQDQRRTEPIRDRQSVLLDFITLHTGGLKYATAYEFMQFDRCKPQEGFRYHFRHKAVSELFNTRQKIENDFLAVIGCNSPKIRLMRQATLLDSKEFALNALRNRRDISHEAVIYAPKATISNFKQTQEKTDIKTTINILEYTANKIKFDVINPNAFDAWLVYADAYHPNWHANINGEVTPIFNAYLAFKSIELHPGKNTVTFEFKNGLSAVASYTLALFGMIFSGWLLVLFLNCFRKSAVNE